MALQGPQREHFSHTPSGRVVVVVVGGCCSDNGSGKSQIASLLVISISLMVTVVVDVAVRL